MRTIGSNGLVLIALMTGVAACAGSTTVYKTGPDDAPVDDPSKTTTPEDPTNTPDPSLTGDPTSKDTPAPPLVKGLAISEVAFLQAVKVPVVTDGVAVSKAARNAPVVQGRPALVRVFVTRGAGYAAGSVTAELRLFDGATRLPALKDTKSISSDSTDEATASTFNFEVPATSLPAGVTYQVLLTSTTGEVPKGAVDTRIPKDGGVQALDVEASGKLKIVIVPVQYDADGSGRLPDVSPTQMDLYKQVFMARYPATEIAITARAPWSYPSAISANGSGFSAVLNAVTNLRKSDGAAADVYYYGAFAPKTSFNSFCGGGCVTGLSSVVDSPNTAFLRASVGVGFAGEDAANTAAHEVGHAHGREHAPCGGAQGTDPDFPYTGGTIGVWGYNILDKTLISPTKGKDMMGYCPNEWVSDYTYKALFDRIAAVNGGKASAGTGMAQAPSSSASSSSNAAPQTYRTALLDADGSIAWGGEVELAEAPVSSHTRVATFVSATGQALGTHTAHFFPYDHLPGGVLVVPSAPQSAVAPASVAAQRSWAQVRIAGATNALAR